MEDSNAIASDRALRYGRNILFLSAIVICAYVFGLQLSEAKILGIGSGETKGPFNANHIPWLVLLTILAYNLFYFCRLAKSDLEIWEYMRQAALNEMPLSVYKTKGTELPKKLVIKNDEWVFNDHPQNYQWKRDAVQTGTSMDYQNLEKGNHTQMYSAYRQFLLDVRIPLVAGGIATVLCVFGLSEFYITDLICAVSECVEKK